FSAVSIFRPTTATCAPCAAIPLTIDEPKTLFPPIATAVFPVKSKIFSILMSPYIDPNFIKFQTSVKMLLYTIFSTFSTIPIHFHTLPFTSVNIHHHLKNHIKTNFHFHQILMHINLIWVLNICFAELHLIMLLTLQVRRALMCFLSVPF